MRTTSLLALVVAGAVAQSTVTDGATRSKVGMRVAVLTKVDATTWKGKFGTSQLGPGQLTLTGRISFRDDGQPADSILRFRATFKKGWLRGCIRNSVLLRPGARQVWDGPAHVTSTSSSLRRFRGLDGHDGGLTKPDDLDHARPFTLGIPGFPQDAGTTC